MLEITLTVLLIRQDPFTHHWQNKTRCQCNTHLARGSSHALTIARSRSNSNEFTSKVTAAHKLAHDRNYLPAEQVALRSAHK